MSCSVGMNTRISPKGSSCLKILHRLHGLLDISDVPVFRTVSSGGRKRTSTGYIRPDTSIIGAPSNARENFSVSMVADVMMSLRSFAAAAVF